MTTRDIYIGREIGNYRIERQIAGGSFGTVYLARHVHLQERTVAIKILHAVHLGSDTEKTRFLQEAQILERLKGLPNILPLLDVGFDGNFPYMLTEYAEHESLRTQMRQHNGPLPLEEIFKIVEQIGKGLQSAHDKGVVHRDLKPENVLFNAQGEALLADFGISTVLLTASLHPTHIAGTPAYMAPEQFRGKVCKESDQYALACIAYELLTGRKLFDAPDFISMGFCHAHEEPTPPRQLNPQIPEVVERAILKALSKERTERYPSVSEFVDALNDGDDQPPPQSEPTVSSDPQPIEPSQSSDSSSISSPLPPPDEQGPQPTSIQNSGVLVLVPTDKGSTEVSPPQRRRSGRTPFLLILSALMAIVILLVFLIPRLVPSQTTGIGVTSVDGEEIGISDGSYAFDTNRPAGPLMQEASKSLREGNPDKALAKWNEAHEKDTNDAEPLIYAEDQRVLTSGSSYINSCPGHYSQFAER